MFMESIEFIKNFAAQFDETDISEFSLETKFKDIDEWSSLNALAVMNMVEKNYSVTMNANDLKQANTIKDLYEIILLKQI